MSITEFECHLEPNRKSAVEGLDECILCLKTQVDTAKIEVRNLEEAIDNSISNW